MAARASTMMKMPAGCIFAMIIASISEAVSGVAGAVRRVIWPSWNFHAALFFFALDVDIPARWRESFAGQANVLSTTFADGERGLRDLH